jgi:hypothetical protein
MGRDSEVDVGPQIDAIDQLMKQQRGESAPGDLVGSVSKKIDGYDSCGSGCGSFTARGTRRER